MSDKCINEIVTEFFLSTCRLRPQLNARLQAAVCCAECAAKGVIGDADLDNVPTTTGSVAEFYIEPMLPHIGDVDVMSYRSTQLAIPRGYPPPTQLPAEFHNYVRVYEIIDSHFPGYVYLQLRYLLTECLDDGKYNAVEYDRRVYLSNRIAKDYAENPEPMRYIMERPWHGKDDGELHGPARIYKFNIKSQIDLPVDVVRCVHSLVWLPQAADWPTRHRNYSWPDSATVDRVVSNGCDVVGVAHRQCKQDKWIGIIQWRLSFSRAEVVLINNWMPVQQIVYHMLRVFVKTDNADESVAESGQP